MQFQGVVMVLYYLPQKSGSICPQAENKDGAEYENTPIKLSVKCGLCGRTFG